MLSIYIAHICSILIEYVDTGSSLPILCVVLLILIPNKYHTSAIHIGITKIVR